MKMAPIWPQHRPEKSSLRVDSFKNKTAGTIACSGFFLGSACNPPRTAAYNPSRREQKTFPLARGLCEQRKYQLLKLKIYQ
jgi:hypothetical protein